MTSNRILALYLAATSAWATAGFAAAAAPPATPAFRTIPVLDGARPPEERVVNGVLEYRTPALAAIRDEVGTLCSGTLIGCRTVLTAANCFCYDKSTGNELTGAQCRTRTDLLDPSRFSVFFQHGGFFPIEKIEINPNYVFGDRSDLALVTLVGSAEGIAPLAINRNQSPPPGTVGKIAGFGRSTTTEDFGLVRSGFVTTSACTTVPADRNVCFAFEDPLGEPGTNSNTCNGDAGGPLLVAFVPGEPRVAGVISSGENAACSAPDQSWNTDVFADRDWIESTAGNDATQTSCGVLPQALTDGTTIQPLSDDLSASDPEDVFTIQLGPGMALLRVALNGAEFNGDPDPNFDLYLKHGSTPSTTSFDCRSTRDGLVEYCEIQRPEEGAWNILVNRVAGEGTYQLVATRFSASPSVCLPGPTTLCLNDQPGDKRFRVTVQYASPPRQLSGAGQAVGLGSLGVERGGLFWFFGADNPEMLVKVLNGCGVNGHFWVFLTAGTDVGYLTTITDTQTGFSRTYSSPDGTSAQPVQDVSAFVCD